MEAWSPQTRTERCRAVDSNVCTNLLFRRQEVQCTAVRTPSPTAPQYLYTVRNKLVCGSVSHTLVIMKHLKDIWLLGKKLSPGSRSVLYSWSLRAEALGLVLRLLSIKLFLPGDEKEFSLRLRTQGILGALQAMKINLKFNLFSLKSQALCNCWNCSPITIALHSFDPNVSVKLL